MCNCRISHFAFILKNPKCPAVERSRALATQFFSSDNRDGSGCREGLVLGRPVRDETFGEAFFRRSCTAPSMTRMRELAPVIQKTGVRILREFGYQGPVDAEVEDLP